VREARTPAVAAARRAARPPRTARLARAPAGLPRALSRVQQGVIPMREYVFIDEWHVDAAPEAVFDALADATTYPEWWTPVYIETTTDGPPGPGRVSQQHFKGRLPYTLRTRS